MSDDNSPDTSLTPQNKYQIGPGLGLLLMGLLYLIFWISPLVYESLTEDLRWSHNWVYSLILITIGASFYQKTVVSRTIAIVQASLMPLTASGAFNTTFMTIVALVILSTWFIVVLIERKNNSPLLNQRISQRTKNWITMHSLIVCWMLIAHMGLVFFIGRLPFESQLDTIGTGLGESIGFLLNLPIERHDLVTYVFDINLIILAVLFGYEQFKVGYNLKNNPWPKISFRFLWITVVLGLVLVPISLQGIIP
ncbi:hypothetical protein E4H12_00640 [Candidatus Thorarchaeota archaeon]|nr:MAG: hypothetical protein E4H12_00640 [Candidatus Thorarchaeota archaeon]